MCADARCGGDSRSGLHALNGRTKLPLSRGRKKSTQQELRPFFEFRSRSSKSQKSR